MMKRAIFLILFAALFSAGARTPAIRSAQTQGADLILHNGRVWTVDEAKPEAEAIAIRDGMIIKEGNQDNQGGIN